MSFREYGIVLESLDMDEQQMLMTCLFLTIGVERIHEIAVQTAAMLRENGRQAAALILEQAARKMKEDN